MRLNSFKVTENYGPRPAGKPDECFYCKQPIGAEHGEKCPMRDRTVVVRMVVEYVRVVPEHWTEEDINFHMNESSWCADNAVGELRRQFTLDQQPCMCHASYFEYVREATEEETLTSGVKIGERVAE